MICDVSKHQGVIDWERLAPALDFAFIRASGKGKDPFFDINADWAEWYGVPWHAYHFLYCINVAQARKEARLFSDSVGEHEPLSFCLDCEGAWGVKEADARGVAEAFVSELRLVRGNVRIGVYVGHEWYSRYRLDYDRFDYVWIPRYGKNDGTPEGSKKPSHPCDLWQYTSVGKAPGISGNVDLNALTGTKPMAYFTDTAESKITGGDNVAIDFDKYILSTGTHYISNSGKDENGTYHGGQAGDQSGHEWELKKWYSRPWTVVLRWPDIKVALKMAELGISAALNDRIGYDQYQRTTYWKQLEKAGYDPSKITVACEEDCTAGVTANCKAAGFLMDVPALEELAIDTYSANMKTRFVRAGFRALTESKYLTCPNYLLPGDVLLYEGHHAAMNITYGKNVRPENVSKPPENMSKPPEDDALLRKGDGGDDVRQMQRLLLKWDPDCLPKYGADGDFGSETLRALTRFQDFRGLAASGVYDEPTRQALVAYTNSLAAGTEQPALEYDEEPAYTVTITGESVNVRAGNSLSSAVLGVVHRGDLLPYQGVKSADGGRTWLLVEYEGQNGWVSDKYAEVTEG